MSAAVEPPRLHHAVIALTPVMIERARSLFTEMGFVFTEFALPDVGLRVLLDWERGIELVTPTEGAPADSPVREFLTRHGDGVFTLAIRVNSAPEVADLTARYGGHTRFAQHRDGPGWSLDEIDQIVLGVPITLLSTDLP